MAKIAQLKWTQIQREIAAEAREGKTFDQLVEMGYTKSLISKVLNAIKSGQKPPTEGEPRTENRELTPGIPGNGFPQLRGATSRAIEVGKITITPENWDMTQYGAILVLDTYNKAKRDINYGGTIGDFICDIFEFSRRILNYTEVEYGRQTGDGGGSVGKNGDESAGRA